MKMTIRPGQITTEYDGAYLNPETPNGGGIGFWLGVHSQPTYLLLDKENNILHFVTFANMTWARDWTKDQSHLEVVWKWEPEEQDDE